MVMYVHVCISSSRNEVQQRNSVNDKPQFFVWEEGEECKEPEDRQQEDVGPAVTVDGPREEEKGEEERAREGRGEIPPERLGLRGVKEMSQVTTLLGKP